MARIISHYKGSDSSFKRALRAFNQLDWFSKTSVVAMILILIATPVALTARIVLTNQAADKFYLAVNGVDENSFFVMKEVASTNIAPNTATITWTTSAQASSEIKYWKNSLLSNLLSMVYAQHIIDPTYTTNHAVNLSIYLDPDTSYKYEIVSTTRSGDVFTSATYSFKTAPNSP